MRKAAFCSLAFLIGVGCGSANYAPPPTSPPNPNSIVIQQPFDQVWAHAIPQIGKSFFVINNIDKSSGILNISYSGDPEQYIDCGNIHVEYGSQITDFPAAKAEEEFTGPSGGVFPARYARKVSLDGRMNIVFEKVSEKSTRVTVNARYIVTVSTVKQVGQYPPTSAQGTAQFNTGGEGNFPGTHPATCRPNGKFEQTILEMVQMG
jgi:hypothetical protein